MGLFGKRENIIVSNSSGDDTCMTMSEYEKLKEEYDKKVKNGEVTGELIKPKNWFRYSIHKKKTARNIKRGNI